MIMIEPFTLVVIIIRTIIVFILFLIVKEDENF